MRPAGLALRAGDLADGLAGLGLFLPRVGARPRQIPSVTTVQLSGFDPATCGFEARCLPSQDMHRGRPKSPSRFQQYAGKNRRTLGFTGYPGKRPVAGPARETRRAK